MTTAQQPIATKQEQARWLSPREVAEVFGVHSDTIYKLVAEDRVPHLRVGRAIRFRLEDIEAALRPASSEDHNT